MEFDSGGRLSESEGERIFVHAEILDHDQTLAWCIRWLVWEGPPLSVWGVYEKIRVR